MKRSLLILFIAILLGVGMYFGSQRMLTPCTCTNTAQLPVENGSLLPELEWLRATLHLSEAQFAKVKTLHLAYQPKCAELCRKVQHCDEALLAAVSHHHKVEGDTVRLMRERADLTLECQQAMLKHAYETAACMEPEQADRYLKTVLPHVLGPAHSRSPAAHAAH